MSRHNGNYRMIAFYWYVLCIGILLSWHANDVMFLGCQANFGTQKNYATRTSHLLADFFIMVSQSNGPSNSYVIVKSQ